MPGRCLVTGASGFVGAAVRRSLIRQGRPMRSAVRSLDRVPPGERDGAEVVAVGEIHHETDWSAALEGVETVLHLAGRALVVRDTATDPLAEYRAVNSGGTERLALMAARAGVKRLVYVSSIKVNGKSTVDRPFTEADDPNPRDACGISKWEAEQALYRVSRQTGLEAVVVRPPLVYGPGVKGNFLTLLRWTMRGVPWPLGRLENRRSMINVENLADLLIRCGDAPAAAGQTFLASDRADLSTPQLIGKLAEAAGRRPRLVKVRVGLLRGAGRLLGKQEIVRRLCDSLMVDTAKAASLLGWSPPQSVDESLRQTVEWYLATPTHRIAGPSAETSDQGR